MGGKDASPSVTRSGNSLGTPQRVGTESLCSEGSYGIHWALVISLQGEVSVPEGMGELSAQLNAAVGSWEMSSAVTSEFQDCPTPRSSGDDWSLVEGVLSSDVEVRESRLILARCHKRSSVGE